MEYLRIEQSWLYVCPINYRTQRGAREHSTDMAAIGHATIGFAEVYGRSGMFGATIVR